jgi:hypothetical protein
MDQNIASWNRIAGWLRRLEGLRGAASGALDNGITSAVGVTSTRPATSSSIRMTNSGRAQAMLRRTHQSADVKTEGDTDTTEALTAVSPSSRCSR